MVRPVSRSALIPFEGADKVGELRRPVDADSQVNAVAVRPVGFLVVAGQQQLESQRRRLRRVRTTLGVGAVVHRPRLQDARGDVCPRLHPTATRSGQRRAWPHTTPCYSASVRFMMMRFWRNRSSAFPNPDVFHYTLREVEFKADFLLTATRADAHNIGQLRRVQHGLGLPAFCEVDQVPARAGWEDAAVLQACGTYVPDHLP